MRKRLSLSDFAKKLGVSRPAIVKAISTGRIPAELVGETELSTGRRVPMILDPVAARAAFLDEGSLALIVTKRPPANRTHSDTESQPPTDEAEASPASSQSPLDAHPPISESRRASETYKAKLLRIEYERQAGKVVPIEEVGQTVGREYANVRAALLAIPAKIADELALSSNATDARLIVEAAITDALSELTADADSAAWPLRASAPAEPQTDMPEFTEE